MITEYNKVIDTYGNKVLKTGFGQYMNTRYEIWEDEALRMHSTDQEMIRRQWKYIKDNEPPVRKREKTPYIEM